MTKGVPRRNTVRPWPDEARTAGLLAGFRARARAQEWRCRGGRRLVLTRRRVVRLGRHGFSSIPDRAVRLGPRWTQPCRSRGALPPATVLVSTVCAAVGSPRRADAARWPVPKP